jgi:hypothetical protein
VVITFIKEKTDVGKADMLKALVSAQASRYAGAYTGILKKTSESA